jgi:hypothetical protein
MSFDRQATLRMLQPITALFRDSFANQGDPELEAAALISVAPSFAAVLLFP